MTRSAERLRPLLDLAGLNGREAAARLALSFSELARAERELEQIRAYLDEYRPASAPGRSVTAGKLASDRRFVDRLAEVIAAQTARVEAIRARHEATVAEWQRAHRHSEAMQQLYDSYCRRELADLERRDAEAVDELMQRWLDPAPR